MKKGFQIEVIMNSALFTSAKKEAKQVKPILSWAKQSALLIAAADEQSHEMFFLDKTKMLVTIYQN